nr:anhydro-N-acetylmuramic acid kinase [candidate division Zixibacteria bacterium]
MLDKVFRKKNLVVVGLNAGTSADGLDLAAARINFQSVHPGIKYITGQSVSYPTVLRSMVDDAINNRLRSLDEYIYLDRRLGIFYGEQASRFCRSLIKSGIKPDLLGSHGQTVRHLPGQVKIGRRMESGTLQPGHPESIAGRCGLPVVADFRQADIAAGGEGAPITSYAMWLLFGNSSHHRLMLNIGGIANYFLFPAGDKAVKMMAADCGPGNSLLDIITRKFFNRMFDQGGRLAARGVPSRRLLLALMADNFLKGKYGPSTGRERFGEQFARKIIGMAADLKLNKHDILATTTELTAAAIARTLKKFPRKYGLNEFYLFGGGMKNPYLIERLKFYFPGISFISVDRLGFNPDYLEAVCYAVMGGLAVKGIPSGLPHITGARKTSMAGRIVQPTQG